MTQACSYLAEISCFFFDRQGIQEHEINETVVCHAGMTDIADDETSLDITSQFLFGFLPVTYTGYYLYYFIHGKPELVVRVGMLVGMLVGMPVCSLCRALMYNQMYLQLSF